MDTKDRFSQVLEEASNMLDKGKDKGKKKYQEFFHGKQCVFHGTLHIEIRRAEDLPDMDGIPGFRRFKLHKEDVTDAYVEVKLGNASLARTNVIVNNLNPVWNESYRLDVCHTDKLLLFCVLDKDEFTSEKIGAVAFLVKDLMNGEKRDGWYPIRRKRYVTSRGKLNLMVQFIPFVSKDNIFEVKNCYFPMRSNCFVTLYQDAHCYSNMPQFANMDPAYDPRSCWTDVYLSIERAKNIILVAGWSLWHNLKLFRHKDTELCIESRTLGEILVAKAKQGVMVYIMLWSESGDGAVGEHMGTALGTFGTETFNYFREAGLDNLKCVLVRRVRESSAFATELFQNEFQTAFYTHHQKIVVCDSSCTNSSSRRLVAYIGGLDLTKGRWDTPNHELFSTLQQEHKDDFRNQMVDSTVLNVEKEGPREPWHDIHCKLEGSIAYDVHKNFRER